MFWEAGTHVCAEPSLRLPALRLSERACGGGAAGCRGGCLGSEAFVAFLWKRRGSDAALTTGGLLCPCARRLAEPPEPEPFSVSPRRDAAALGVRGSQHELRFQVVEGT